MSDQIRKLKNQFIVAGKLAEIESINRGTTKDNKIPYISVKFVVQYGDNSAASRRLEVYSQEYSIDKNTKKKKESKGYKKISDFFNKNEDLTIAKVGYDEATSVKVEGAYSINDYVNAENELKTNLTMDASFFNPVDKDKDGKLEFYAQATLEGYIHSITPEVKGENGEETGRYKLNLITTSFRGEAIPVTMFISADTADEVTSVYEAGQTAQFYADYVLNKSESKPKTGGFGVKRDAEKVYAELVIVGADAPIDCDEENAISAETVKKIMQVRNEALDEIKAKGYQGNKDGKSKSSGSTKSSKATAANTDDIPF